MAVAENTNNSNGVDNVMRTADGTPLKLSLQRAQRRQKQRTFFLVVPLLVFILFSFVFPILNMLTRSIEDPQVISYMPNTLAALEAWEGESVPDESVFAAMAQDFKIGRENKTIGRVGKRLNYEKSGMRGLFNKTSRRIDKIETGPWKQAFFDIDNKWADVETFTIIKRHDSAYSASYYMAALDLKQNEQNEIVRQDEERRIYISLFLRTFGVSFLIAVLTLLLGFPIAYLMANLPLRYSNLLMILVLLPFWTSLLVRTTSWIVLLQSQGVVNDVLVSMGVIDDENRIQMIFNMTGTVVAMTHILLPFMVLPLYSVMRTIPPSYMRAARSLGANQFVAFVRIYLPQTVPGISAGAILVFILAIGYYITPALVGGETGQLISNIIAYHMQRSLNWGLAGALGSILLLSVLVFFGLYSRFVGLRGLKFG